MNNDSPSNQQLDEERLILYYYDELSQTECDEISNILASNTQMAIQYAGLKHQFDQWAQFDDEAAPARLELNLIDLLNQQAAAQNGHKAKLKIPFDLSSYIWGLATAATMVFGIGFYYYAYSPLQPASAHMELASTNVLSTPVHSTKHANAFERGLKVYLSESRRNVAQLSSNASEQRAQLISRIIQQNRLFEHAAESNNASDIARLLRAFEPLLAQLADEELRPSNDKELSRQLEFEYAVLLTKLESQTSLKAQSI